MRHQVFGRKLNRDIKERKALFKSLIFSLITRGRIQTTVAKAKAITRLVDKLVTHAKDGSNSAARQISSILSRKEAINKLMSEIAPKFKNKFGGYLRMVRVGKRLGDNAEEVILEWSMPEEKRSVTNKMKEKEEDGKPATQKAQKKS